MNKRKIIFYLFLILGLILYLHNYLVYPPTRGSDSADHIAYIKYIAEYKKIPKASDGFEMYQPPFYYLLAALFYSLGVFLKISDPLKLSQLISLLSAFGNIILIFLISRKIFKSFNLQILITLFSVFLPMHLYESPVVSNELLTSFLSSLAIYYLLTNEWESVDFFKSIILGTIAGLACLTKYTGLILLFCIIFYFCWQFYFKRHKGQLINALILLLTTIIISSWFYLRQYLLFQNPLIIANDPKLFPFWQEPGFRDWHFYFNLEGLIPLKVFGGPLESFWAGTYNSAWIDSHRTFLPVFEFSKAGAIIIYLALIPTFTFIAGLLRAIKINFQFKAESKYLFLTIFSIISFLTYISWTYKIPYYSSVKAFYLLSNILPLAIFFGLGSDLVIKWLKNYRLIYYSGLLILTLLIYKLYWYRSWWKNIGE